jgi:hypothetical protein
MLKASKIRDLISITIDASHVEAVSIEAFAINPRVSMKAILVVALGVIRWILLQVRRSFGD